MNLKMKLIVILTFALIVNFTNLAFCQKNGNDYAKEGLAYYSKGDCKNAIDSLNKAADYEDLKDSDTIYYSLALAYHMCGDLDKSIMHMLEAIKIKKNDFNYHKFLGRLYFAQKNYEDAIFQLETANQLNPGDFNINFNLYTAYSGKKEYIKALPYLVESVKMKPKLKMINYRLGSIYLKLKEYDKAIESFEKEINYNPNDYNSYYYLAVAYNEIKRYDKAMESLEMAIKIKNNTAKFYDFLIRLALRQNKFDKVMEYSEKFGKNCPDFKDQSQYFIGCCYYDKEDFPKTIDILEKVNPKKLNNKNSDRKNLTERLCRSYNQVGYDIYQKNDFEKALEIYKKALKLCPDSKDANRGVDASLQQIERKKQLEEQKRLEEEEALKEQQEQQTGRQ